MKLRFHTRVVLILALAIISSATALAQRYYTPHFDIGGKAGITMSSIQFSPSVEQSMLMGKMGGISIRYTEEKVFGLIAELNIEQRGWKEDFEDKEFEYQRQLTYVQLPILTHISFGGRKVKGFINLGPAVSYMLGSKISSNFNYENPSSVSGFPLQYRRVNQMKLAISNKIDYGIMAGGGIEFILKRKHSFMLEGRYYFGLGNIFPSSRKDEFSSSRSSSIQVSLAYMLRIK